jgi:Immunoglobulin I-set domain.
MKIMTIFVFNWIQVEWYLDERPVSGKNLLVSANGDRHVLAVVQATLDHSGKVSCVAENEAGKATCVARLSVKCKYMSEFSQSHSTPHSCSVV